MRNEDEEMNVMRNEDEETRMRKFLRRMRNEGRSVEEWEVYLSISLKMRRNVLELHIDLLIFD